VYRAKNPIYERGGIKGRAVGVHVVGRKWEDEKVLGMCFEMDRVVFKCL